MLRLASLLAIAALFFAALGNGDVTSATANIAQWIFLFCLVGTVIALASYFKRTT